MFCVCVFQLEKYLLKMVAKQWYDYDRSSLALVRKLRECSPSSPLTLRHSRDFDECGLIHWIGTNGKTVSEWVNPAQVRSLLLLPSFTEFHLVLPSSNTVCLVLLGFSEFYLVLPSFTQFYLVLLGFT